MPSRIAWTCLLVSADSDLVGPVKAIRRLFPQMRVIVAFPPACFSGALKAAVHGHTFIGRNVLSKSVFPDQVTKPDGFVLQRPGVALTAFRFLQPSR
ncbi:MAG: hypothetical protein ACUVWZ_14465 [Anaerolineae bacterium]